MSEYIEDKIKAFFKAFPERVELIYRLSDEEIIAKEEHSARTPVSSSFVTGTMDISALLRACYYEIRQLRGQLDRLLTKGEPRND